MNAPRFRSKKYNILNRDFYNRLLELHPELKEYSYKQVREIIKSYNGAIRETVVDYRDGIEFPLRMGYCFIGTCPRKKSDNPNFKLSTELNQKVQFRNFESDNYTAKIFYTNYESKYQFRMHELWGFKALTEFRKTVGRTYPDNWKIYVKVDNYQKISRLFRKSVYKDKMARETERLLKSYDEFEGLI